MRRARAGRIDESRALTLPLRARKVLVALPDGITSLVFLSAWIAPLHGPAMLVKNLVLTMLIEFFVIHANGFMMSPMTTADATRARRVRAVVSVSVLYLGFISIFCIVFEATWPLYVFGWLVASKILFAWTDRGTGHDEGHQGVLWAASAALYIVGVIVTGLIPLPRLGIDGAGADYGIPGSGLWVESPHVPIALGVIYFGALAWLKSKLVGAEGMLRA